MNILITGANGQLGSEIKAISGKYDKYNFIYTDRDELDITNIEDCISFFKANNINCVINCAAYTAVDKAEEDVFMCYMLNATAVRNLVEACNKTDSYLIQISTDYVFDGKTFMPYKEDDKTNPQSEYGRSKLEGERIALTYSKALVIRTSWLYSNFGNNFVKTMLRLGKEKKCLNVIFDQIGTPTYAHDFANTILNVVEQTFDKNKIDSGIYHYSNEGVCSWYDFTCRIFALSNITGCKVNPIETKDYPTLAARPPYSVLNKSKIKSVYGIEIPNWDISLAKMLEKELEK